MHGYLVIPGDYPIARVSYNFVPSLKLAEGFVERDGFSVKFPRTPLESPASVGPTDDVPMDTDPIATASTEVNGLPEVEGEMEAACETGGVQEPALLPVVVPKRSPSPYSDL